MSLCWTPAPSAARKNPPTPAFTCGRGCALRHITYGDPKRLFSFRLSPGGLEQLSGAAEAYLLTQLERGFRTLDFYKQLAAPFAVPTKQE